MGLSMTSVWERACVCLSNVGWLARKMTNECCYGRCTCGLRVCAADSAVTMCAFSQRAEQTEMYYTVIQDCGNSKFEWNAHVFRSANRTLQ